MQPIDPLIREHRLIERMVNLLVEELKSIQQSRRVNLPLLDTAVDFFRTYGDRCHHGKEEFILFAKLEKKGLSPEHQQIMAELVEDHLRNRETVDSLMNAKSRYAKGEKGAIREIQRLLEEIRDSVPRHIEKEEKNFFVPAMQYLSDEEKDALLREEFELDRTLIHEKYRLIVDRLQPARSETPQKVKAVKSTRP